MVLSSGPAVLEVPMLFRKSSNIPALVKLNKKREIIKIRKHIFFI
jgi:hypothetical protein